MHDIKYMFTELRKIQRVDPHREVLYHTMTTELHQIKYLFQQEGLTLEDVCDKTSPLELIPSSL